MRKTRIAICGLFFYIFLTGKDNNNLVISPVESPSEIIVPHKGHVPLPGEVMEYFYYLLTEEKKE